MAKVIINNLPYQDLEIMGLIPLGEKGQPGGVAELGEDGKVPAAQLPPLATGEPPTLEGIGAEPVGAESRSRIYTDNKVGAIAFPAPPTLESLGAEPQGAELRSRIYTDNKVGAIAFPAPPTLESLGAEPQGAEARVRQYIDQRFPPAVTPTTEIRVNCGGLAYTDINGKAWQADAFFQFGNADTSYNGVIGASYDFLLFNSSRAGGAGGFNYAFTVPNGNYRVELGFSENWHNTVNSRKFHVNIEGVRVLSDFDIRAQAGMRYSAIKRSFNTTVSDGVLNIVFVPTVDTAQINNIYICSI